jgi:hypothetical protein
MSVGKICSICLFHNASKSSKSSSSRVAFDDELSHYLINVKRIHLMLMHVRSENAWKASIHTSEALSQNTSSSFASSSMRCRSLRFGGGRYLRKVSLSDDRARRRLICSPISWSVASRKRPRTGAACNKLIVVQKLTTVTVISSHNCTMRMRDLPNYDTL